MANVSIIKKADMSVKEFYQHFEWINFDKLWQSKGYGMLFHFPDDVKVRNQDLMHIFYALFTPFLDDMVISFLNPTEGNKNGGYGGFCLDTWDIDADRRDYSPEGKTKQTAKYLNMLKESGIEPNYNGLLVCHDWDQFLPLMLSCVLRHIAPYSFYFYSVKNQFTFSFHHRASLAIFYKSFNDAILHILEKAKAENLELWDWNDKESLAKLSGENTEDES